MLRAPKLEPGDVVRSISSTADENELNDAFRDPAVRAIVVSASGNGAHRIAHRLDFEAVRRDPKPVIGRAQATYPASGVVERVRTRRHPRLIQATCPDDHRPDHPAQQPG
ncbi:LD-carboxypeptidase [Kribbella catacumbae]|uniref:LD-carboxypeptidase n=1 Tax=Kribbella catacumbae TaxID=460086 RepID=UPI000A03F562